MAQDTKTATQITPKTPKIDHWYPYPTRILRELGGLPGVADELAYRVQEEKIILNKHLSSKRDSQE